jgi:hypothetical protein
MAPTRRRHIPELAPGAAARRNRMNTYDPPLIRLCITP